MFSKQHSVSEDAPTVYPQQHHHPPGVAFPPGRGLAPSARLCVALARACAETSNAEEAKQLRRRMRAAQVEPDVGLRAAAWWEDVRRRRWR